MNNLKTDRPRTVCGIAAILWMCMIFAFSHQPSEESSEVSMGLSYRLVSSSNTFFHLNYDEAKVLEIAQKIEGPVRKAAHMTEYGVLAFFIYVWIGKWMNAGLKRYLSALLISALYAASDEIHQLFIPGRSGRVTDVLIDSSGALIVIVICALADSVSNKKQRDAREESAGRQEV